MIPLRFPERREPLRLLCLGAHSDDIEIGCGGTILRLLDEHPGSEIRYVVFAASPERAAEARAASAELLAGAARATVDVHGFKESYFPWVGDALKDAFEALKRSFEPD